MKVRIGKMLAVSVATLLVMCGVAFATEVTWSVMHPTELDPAYMARVVEKAVEYGGVDSFEVCGTCHSGMGGMDGLLLFEPYRKTFDKRDKAKVEKLRIALKGVVHEAHKAGKKVYYWHREGFLPDGILDDLPSLRDENGEIDLMGEAFYSYLRWRIASLRAASSPGTCRRKGNGPCCALAGVRFPVTSMTLTCLIRMQSPDIGTASSIRCAHVLETCSARR